MNPFHGAAGLALSEHARQLADLALRDLFRHDPGRAERFSLEACGILLDYSKNRLTDVTLRHLADLAGECGLQERIAAMFRGDKINATEGRAALHTALRNLGETPVCVDGNDVMPGVRNVRERMGEFCNLVRSAQWLGYTGQPITDIVNIGIGGSDLGPLLACEALAAYGHPRFTMHFVSNVDGAQLEAVLRRVHPETTLFIVASKTFTTQETLTNAITARRWFLASARDEGHIAAHFVAVSTNRKAVREFGIDPANMFEFWSWVGGRYSLWSAIGLPLALYIGPRQFTELLAGAHAMDEHFRNAPLLANLPVLLALIGIWNIQYQGARSAVVAPYNQGLKHLPAYLQQLEMESNGKSVRVDGSPVDYPTSPVIWGDTGINGQHAYFQMLHQGTQPIPIDFLVALDNPASPPLHHRILLANLLAQAEAFMRGKTADEARAELLAQGIEGEAAERLVPHKVFPGNRPSTILFLDRLDPRGLGALLALYEHKVFCQGVIWGINSFDQWGVELGKQLAQSILADLDAPLPVASHDASTNRLINHARRHLSRQPRRAA